MKSEVMSGRGWKCMSSLGAVTHRAASVVEDGNEKQSPKLLTLVIVKKDERVLLGMKKRGFGAGYFSGFGGKVEAKETIDEAAARELQEECGVVPLSMEKRGILTFHFDDNPQPWEAHVYRVGDYAGAPRETEEMAPRWFSLTDIPYDKMWQDNPIWCPEFLRGRLLKGDFYFQNTHTLVSHTLHVLQNLVA
jgi:8-oxo-dGTP pyrophosphatase MutT (NUDIX family)